MTTTTKAYRDIQALEAMHRGAYQPALTAAVEAVLGERASCHSGKFVRLGFPQPFRLIEPNQEYLIAQSGVRMITSWIPLAPCPPEAGTVNASVPQQSGEVSPVLEPRHQPVSRPLRSGLALPHMFPILPNWSVLTEGWSSRQWVELPLGVEVRTVPRESDFERIEFQPILEEARERP